jgi:DNA polymerase
MTDRRRYYLQTMGIDVWQRRRIATAALEPAAQSVASAVVEADADAAPGTFREPPQTDAVMSEPPLLSAGDERTARIATLDWQALADEVENCTACELHAGRTRAVFGVGNRQADWMIIGEAPGADEDRLGEPFVGRAGKLLELMLQALGLRREDIYIANILKSRPPRNRDPSAQEVRACWPYLARQVELVEPKIILAMGRIAAQNLLESTSPVGRLRGRVHHFGTRRIPLIVTYHPAYLLRSPREKRKSWEDLQMALRTLAGLR